MDGGTEEIQDNHGNDICSEFTVCQETSSTFAPAVNKSLGLSKADAKDPLNFTAFVPLVKNVVNLDKSNVSHMTDGPRRNYKSSEAVAMDVLRDNGAGEILIIMH